MNNFLNVFFRSLIESATEFLPVSSTGHLFLFSYFFPFQDISHGLDFDDLFDIFIQSGAILSVLVIFFPLLKEKFLATLEYLNGDNSKKEAFDFQVGILIGAVPIMLVGFLFKKYLDQIKSSSFLLLILASAWILGGLVFIWVEKKIPVPKIVKPQMEKKHALIVGLFQCLALIPGVSRSAATIISARILGYSRTVCTEYSFFLAVPVLIAASLYKLYKHRAILNTETIPYLVLGFLITFFICNVIIKWFLGYVRRHSFEVFGYYRVLLGLVVLWFYYLSK